MKIVTAGTSGFIGRSLEYKLSQSGHEVVRLTRRARSGGSARQVVWDPAAPGDWMKEMDGADAIINMAGEGIADKRWTAARKKDLITSRVNTTKALVDAISRARVRPKALLNASAIGFYGPRGPEPLDEAAAGGAGFLADTCREWERQALKAEALGTRVVLLRTGLVLGKRGGALAKMLLPFRLGLGGPLGDGKQIYSWIHLEDEVGAIVYALEHDNIRGPVNLTAPEPVPMAEFARTLGKVVGRPAVLPAPAFAVKLLLGEMAEMLLTGQNVVPGVLQKTSFRFRYPSLQGALEACVRP